jgi:competence protein ComEC
VLWPPANEPVGKIANDSSLVLRLSDGRTHFLLTGDIEKQTEEELVAERAPLAADFRKVPHHGSRTSSTQEFLAAIVARVAVVSVSAANPFGHPAPEIVERYADDGIRLLRTDRDGAVTALTGGQNLSVHTYADQP